MPIALARCNPRSIRLSKRNTAITVEPKFSLRLFFVLKLFELKLFSFEIGL